MIALLNDLSTAWAPIFIAALIQNTLFLLLVLGLLRLLKGASAGLRYGLAFVGLAKLLLPPVLKWPASPQVTEATGEGFVIPWVSATLPANPSASTAPDLTFYFFLLWILGAAATLALPLAGTFRLAWRLRRASLIPRGDLAVVDLPERVKVFESDRIALPMTLALYPRRIFVPRDWRNWSPRQLRLFLRHELAHLKRGDGQMQLLQLLSRSLWFFHPLALILGRRLDELREMACDDSSLAADRDQVAEYARDLVETAERALRHSEFCETASALARHRNGLQKRVEYQFKGGNMQTTARWRTGIALAALLILLPGLSWAPAEPAKEKKSKTKIEKKVKQATGKEKELQLTLLGDGKMELFGKQAGYDKLDALLGELKAKELYPVVNLSCAKGVSMGDLYKLNGFLVERDCAKVRFMSDGSEARPFILPSKGAAKKVAQLEDKDVTTILVPAKGKILMDGKKVSTEKLSELLTMALDSNEFLVVALRSEPETSYTRFMKAFASAQAAGAQRIAVLPPKS